MKTKLTLTASLFFLSIIMHTAFAPHSPLSEGCPKDGVFLFGTELLAQNVGINGSGATAHASALLDLDDQFGGNNKGLLVPRIPLTAINAAAPVTSPALSLLVYNTASASTGTNAVSPGYYYWDGAKWVRFAYNASGNSANDWNTLGNAGTVDGTNFIGTTDNVPFNIRVNNQKAGRVDNVLDNTFLGYMAGNSIATGSINTAIGSSALFNCTTGYYNIAIGSRALYSNTSGEINVAVGPSSLHQNTTGLSNVAVGYVSLFNNTTGYNNTAIGREALYYNTNGRYNAAIGDRAGFSSATGNNNTFLGTNTDVTVSTLTLTNATAIGYNAKVGQSNALILGGTGADAVNVGIGTTAPNSKLEIFTNISNPRLAIRSGSVSNSEFALENTLLNKSWFISQDGGNDVLAFTHYNGVNGGTLSSPLNAMVITPLGNVGINTSAPSEKLEVQGSVKIVDGTQGAGKVLTSDANGKGSWVDPSLNLFQGSWALGYNSVPISTVNTNPTYTGLSIVLPPGKYLVTAQVGFQALANSPTWRYLGYSTSIIPTTVTNTRFLGGRTGGTQPTYNESFIHYVTWTVDLSSMSGNTTLYFFQSDTVTLTNGLSGCCGDQYSVSALPVK